MSSYSIYGFIKSSSAKENDLPMPISSYAKTKKLCEDLLLKHNKSNKINIKNSKTFIYLWKWNKETNIL